ncbi:MAG: hypothetical protein ACK5S5_07510 [Planctomycetota bacterium]
MRSAAAAPADPGLDVALATDAARNQATAFAALASILHVRRVSSFALAAAAALPARTLPLPAATTDQSTVGDDHRLLRADYASLDNMLIPADHASDDLHTLQPAEPLRG